MFKFKHLQETIAVFISNAISDHEMSFEIKHTIKNNFRLKLGKSYAYWASTQFSHMLIEKMYLQAPLSSGLSLSLCLLFPHDYNHTWTWFCTLFWCIVVLLDPSVQLVGFLRCHLSINFVLLVWIESLYVKLKCHYYQEACCFLQKLYIQFLFLLIYLSFSWLTVFPQLPKDSSQ